MNNLIQRILILSLATLMFATGWKMASINPVLQHKDCVTVLINMKENNLIDVLNESHIPIVYEVEQSMAVGSQYRTWVITINETNHNRMPETTTSPVHSNNESIFEMERSSNYFRWMTYTNPGPTNKTE